jgi:hypothetical protein
MGAVDRLNAEPLLEGEAAREFDRSRGRVASRHRSWRESFPAIGLLLDSDEDRAQALAGNYATEARETVGVWLSAFESAPEEDIPVEARVAWIEGFWEAWRQDVYAGDDFGGLEEGPRLRFVSVFDELSERFRGAAVDFVREGRSRKADKPTIMQRLTAPFRAAAKAAKGFFFPSVGR